MRDKFPTFNIYDYKDLKCNFHTHTPRCGHATGEEREYVENAIKAGFEVLGFADHAPYLLDSKMVSRIRMPMEAFEGYVRTIEDLKKEYANEIQIFAGLEMEYFSKYFDKTFEELRKYPLDYLILGQHYFDSEVKFEYAGCVWEEEERLITYVDNVIAGIETGLFSYVAHPDIIHYVGDDAIYEKHMCKLVKAIKAHHMPIELNVNGYLVQAQYPNPTFVRMGIEEGCDFIAGIDAHEPEKMLDEANYKGCIQMAAALGGNVMWK